MNFHKRDIYPWGLLLWKGASGSVEFALTAYERRKRFSPPLSCLVSLFSRSLFHETRHTAAIPSCPWPPTLQGLPLLEKVTALYIVHVNTFPSPNGRQLLNPGRLTGVQANARAWPLGAFITCLVGSALVYRGTQPQEHSLSYQLHRSAALFPYMPPAERTAAPWEAIFFPYRKRGGSKGQHLVFTVIYSFMQQITPSICVSSINTSSVLI